MLAALEATRRSSVLFVAAWICLGSAALPRLVARPSPAQPLPLARPTPSRAQSALLLGALCSLVLDMLLGSRPNVRSVGWLALWTALEAGQLANLPRMTLAPRAAKTAAATADDGEAADLTPHVFLQNLLASLILVLVGYLDDRLAVLVRGEFISRRACVALGCPQEWSHQSHGTCRCATRQRSA